MRNAVAVVLIIGFLILDWLRFHDIFKPGETITVADWLTGVLSLLVFYIAADSLLGHNRTPKTA